MKSDKNISIHGPFGNYTPESIAWYKKHRKKAVWYFRKLAIKNFIKSIFK